ERKAIRNQVIRALAPKFDAVGAEMSGRESLDEGEGFLMLLISREAQEASPPAENKQKSPAKESSPANPREAQVQPRYDGKTFEEWRAQWRNDLKIETRIEAIQAMATFGRAGYGPEAAEAIFEVAAEY